MCIVPMQPRQRVLDHVKFTVTSRQQHDELDGTSQEPLPSPKDLHHEVGIEYMPDVPTIRPSHQARATHLHRRTMGA